MITKRTKYALKAMLYLAAQPPGQPTVIADVAEAEAIPRKFLEQILVQLKQAGLLESRMGKRGGYWLSRSADQITFGDVMRQTGAGLAPVPCVSRTAYRPCGDCRDETACAVRAVMADARDALAGVLDAMSLADGLKKVEGKLGQTGISYSI